MKWRAKLESLKPRYFEIKEDPTAGFYLYAFEGDKCLLSDSRFIQSHCNFVSHICIDI